MLKKELKELLKKYESEKNAVKKEIKEKEFLSAFMKKVEKYLKE